MNRSTIGVGNLVGDLVGMAFGNRFGREDVIAAHRERPAFLKSGEKSDIKISLYARSLAALCAGLQSRERQRSSSSANSSGRTLPKRANRRRRPRRPAGGRRSPRPCARAGCASSRPSASITAEMPVGVERSTGSPSSSARSRAWARCWGGPQAPNQASLDGLNRKAGPVPAVDHLAREDDLVAELEADLADQRQVERARARARIEIDVAGREARQAERREDRPHRQIFAIGDEMRLVVAAEDPAGRGRSRRRCWWRWSRSRPSAERQVTPPVRSRSLRRRASRRPRGEARPSRSDRPGSRGRSGAAG